MEKWEKSLDLQELAWLQECDIEERKLEERDEFTELAAELAVLTITEFVSGIAIELCVKHSEIISPELMRIYNFSRQRWAEGFDNLRRKYGASHESPLESPLEAKERWLAYKAELVSTLSAFDQGNNN